MQLSPVAMSDAARTLDAWSSSVPTFAREALGIDPWTLPPGVEGDSQLSLFESIPQNLRHAITSGHKTGKLLADETLVPTPIGWRRHGDLRAGDIVFDEHGRLTRIVATKRWIDRPLMRVTFEDGTHVDADERHEWTVHTRESRKRTHKQAVTVETRELRKRLTVANGRNAAGDARRVANFTVDLAGPLDVPRTNLPLDPYLLGLWLGDGNSNDGGFTGIDGLERAFVAGGFEVRKLASKQRYAVHGLCTGLRALGVLRNKHVPDAYLWAGTEQRLALLQGLMDTDGTCDMRSRCSFTNTNENLARSVLHLARSLGLKARIREDRATLYGKDCGPCWEVSWSSPLPVFRLARKFTRLRTRWAHKANAHRRMAIVSVEPLSGRHSAQCIQVEAPSGLYLCGESMVPTHNSNSLSVIALWAYTCLEARVVLTAPTGHQIDDILWREVSLLHRKARVPLGGRLYETAHNGLRHPSTGAEIFGLSTNEPEAFSGISWHTVVYIVDEGSGVDKAIYEAIQGNRAGGRVWLIVASNPTQITGEFYDAFHVKAHLYRRHHFDSTVVARHVTPRMERRGVFGLATQRWIEEVEEEWKPGTPVHDIRVHGRFPVLSTSTIISRAETQCAQEKWADTGRAFMSRRRLEVGVDVARFGDDTSAIAGRRGTHMHPIIRCSQLDTVVLALTVERAVKEWATSAEREYIGGLDKPVVRVDTGGIGGGVKDLLAMRLPWCEVVGVNFAQSAKDEAKFVNARAEMAFCARDYLRTGGTLPVDAQLADDLVAVQYKFDRLQRFQVEPKEDIKKRLGRSPDAGDAVWLSAYDAPSWGDRAKGAITIVGL